MSFQETLSSRMRLSGSRCSSASSEIAKDFQEDLVLELRILAHLRIQDIANTEMSEEDTETQIMGMKR